MEHGTNQYANAYSDTEHIRQMIWIIYTPYQLVFQTAFS